jgi:molecular chaperone GrpE (heat shock protein)
MSHRTVSGWFGNLGWFRRKKEEEEEDPQRLILEETQNLKKLFRKQSVLLEEVHREQQNSAAGKKRDMEPLLDLCDALFYLHRAFQNPGLMSRQHAQVLNMVQQKMQRFAISFDIEMILAEGIPFDASIHEAVTNRSPDALSLEVLEVIQPGYLQDGKVVRSAKVIVGNRDETPFLTPERMKAL